MHPYQHSFAFSYRLFGFFIVVFFLFGALVSPVEGVIAVNSIHSPFFDFFFTFLTNMGNGFILVPFVIMLCFRNISMAIGLIVSAVMEGIIVSLSKRILFRMASRPITMLDHSSVHMVPGVDIHTAMTFPSGHTVTIFGLCIYLALCYRNNFVTVVLVLFASLVAISRVYLLQHFVTDIAAGALIGTLAGVLTYHWIEQTKKPRWMNLRLAARKKLTGRKPKFS
jgi:membrane-associated phospholipid phosphatase